MAQDLVIHPTVLVVDDGEEFGFLTFSEDDIEALAVFRGPEEATRFQERTGRHTPEEGYKRIGLQEPGALKAILDKQGLTHVAMPEPWTGKGGIDLFAGEDFVRILEEAERV